MIDHTKEFYDQLADDYHRIFADWRKSVRRQGVVLGKLIRLLGHQPPASLLDCSCGIGTQAIGLALQGYKVQGTDLSQNSIIRARKEAKSFGVKIKFQSADLRQLSEAFKQKFEIVVSCDNSIPHLPTENDLKSALANISNVLKFGGVFLASIRDYDLLIKERPVITVPAIYGTGSARCFSFQEWIWDKKRPAYTLNHFVVKKKGNGWEAISRSARYNAIKRADLSKILKAAGLSQIKWHFPAETGYYQPVVTAIQNSKGE